MAKKQHDSLFERLVALSYRPLDQNENGCWLWLRQKGTGGYAKVSMYVNHGRTTRYAHREMEGVFLGRRLEHHETIDHLCDEPSCINPDHWVIDTVHRNIHRRNVKRYKHTPHAFNALPQLQLTPTPDPLQRAADEAWEGAGSVMCASGEPCPF